jgi:hypothetical protein
MYVTEFERELEGLINMKDWTPGRIAFEAFTESIAPNVAGSDLMHWVALKGSAHKAWEAAANAVLADRDKRFRAERETRWRPTEVPAVERLNAPVETGLTPVEAAPEPATLIETAPDEGR